MKSKVPRSCAPSNDRMPSVSRPPRDHVKPCRLQVFVCYSGKICPTKASQDLVGALRELLAKRGLQDDIRVTKSGCLSLCDIGPNMVIYPQGVWYSGVRRQDLEEIVENHLVHGKPVARLLSPQSPQKEHHG